MFLRFVAGTEAENAYWLDGIFTVARGVCDAGELHAYDVAFLEEVFAWFNAYLPCPPFRRMHRAGRWTRDAVSWFLRDAGDPLRRMWDLVALLEEHAVAVRMVQAHNPGPIVYRDRFQIVAETPLWAKHFGPSQAPGPKKLAVWFGLCR
jgi:hypothetical protein